MCLACSAVIMRPALSDVITDSPPEVMYCGHCVLLLVSTRSHQTETKGILCSRAASTRLCNGLKLNGRSHFATGPGQNQSFNSRGSIKKGSSCNSPKPTTQSLKHTSRQKHRMTPNAEQQTTHSIFQWLHLRCPANMQCFFSNLEQCNCFVQFRNGLHIQDVPLGHPRPERV